MNVLFEWLGHHVHAEINLVVGAPLFSIASLAICGAILWVIFERIYGDRLASWKTSISTKNDHIAFLEGQLNQYKSKLSGATPDQAAGEIAELKTELGTAKSAIKMLTDWYDYQTSQRALTPEQRKLFIEALRDFNVEYKPMINIAAIGEPEAQQFAIEIMHALQEVGICLGWTEPAHIASTSPDERGVLLVVQNQDAPPECAIHMMEAFARAGIKTNFDQPIFGMPTPPCIIMVSHKPNPEK